MTNHQEENKLVFNGLDATTGSYLVDPLLPDELRDRAFALQEKNVDFLGSKDHLENLGIRDLKTQNAFDLSRSVPPDQLDKAGWGIILPEMAPKERVDAILEALSDLVTMRQEKAGSLFHIYYGKGDGYRPGETGEAFAQRHGVGPGSVNPKKMPYYLLIIADPISIPYSFQYQLDVQFAVGRIYFENMDEYAQYARSVWTAEQQPAQVALARKAIFFGTANPDDQATQLSSTMMIDSLHKFVDDEHGACRSLGWTSERPAVEHTCKSDLLNYLGGKQTPALLFSATHGLGWPSGHKLQKQFQGALVCQNWPGPKAWTGGEMPQDYYVSAEDIDGDSSLLGSIVFFFACYGAGTPDLDDYSMALKEKRRRLAAQPFLSALPGRLLSHPRGGALAVVGHVERAWGYSFNFDMQDAEPESYKDFIYDTMRGMPVGYAMESLNTRYGQTATAFSREIENSLKWDRNFDSMVISRLWMFNNDARAYAILGDPAVRAPAAEIDAAAALRPNTTGITLRGGQLPEMLATVGTDETGKSISSDSLPKNAGTGSVAEHGDGSAGNESPTQWPGKPGPERVAYAISPIEGLAIAVQMYDSGQPSYDISSEIQARIGPVVKSLFDALQQTTQKLQEAATQAATLKVSTGVVDADSLNDFDPFKQPAGKVNNRFITTISLTGDTQLYVTRQVSTNDEILLNLHKEMVAQAHGNRMEMMRTLTEMIAKLFGGGK